MPLEAAKKAKIREMKCCSVGEDLIKSAWLVERSISLAFQKDASAFLHTLNVIFINYPFFPIP